MASANARPRRKRIFKVYSRDEIGDSNGSLERLTGGRGLQKNKKNKDGDMASAWEVSFGKSVYFALTHSISLR